MIILRRFGLLFCSLKWGHASMNMPACTLFNEQNKGPSLLSIITWSVLGKQNVQAEKVYWDTYHRISSFFLLWVWESAPAMFRHSSRGTKTEAGKYIAQGWTLLCNTFLYLFSRGNVKFCYPTQTTHGQKVYYLYPFLKDFPLIPCFRKFHVFGILEYSVYSAIPQFHHSMQ